MRKHLFCIYFAKYLLYLFKHHRAYHIVSLLVVRGLSFFPVRKQVIFYIEFFRAVTVVIALLFSSQSFGQDKIPEMLEEIKHAESDSLCARAYGKIYLAYRYSYPDTVYYFLEKGLDELTRKRSKYGVALLQSLLGIMDNQLGNIELAKKRQLSSLKAFEELGDRHGIGSANNFLGIIEIRKGNLDIATKHFLRTLKEYKAIANHLGVANVYMNLGITSDKTGNRKKALQYYNLGLTAMKDTSDVSTMCNLYNNIGIIYGRLGKLDTALLYFQKAVDGADTTEHIDLYIYSLLNTGILYKMYGDDERALKVLREGLQLARNKKLVEEQARLIMSIASVEGKSDPQLALDGLKEALDISISLGTPAMVAEVYTEMIPFYKQLGEYENVATLLEKKQAIKDSLYTIKK